MEINSINWQVVMTFLEVALVGGIFVTLLNFHKKLKAQEKKRD